MLDSDHPSRPVKRILQGNPWMIEDATGRQIGYGEVWAMRPGRVVWTHETSRSGRVLTV